MQAHQLLSSCPLLQGGARCAWLLHCCCRPHGCRCHRWLQGWQRLRAQLLHTRLGLAVWGPAGLRPLGCSRAAWQPATFTHTHTGQQNGGGYKSVGGGSHRRAGCWVGATQSVCLEVQPTYTPFTSTTALTLSTAPLHARPSKARQLLASTEQRSCSTALAGLPGWMLAPCTALPGATAAWYAAMSPSNVLRRSCGASAGSRSSAPALLLLSVGCGHDTGDEGAGACMVTCWWLSIRPAGSTGPTSALVVSEKPDTTTRTADCTL